MAGLPARNRTLPTRCGIVVLLALAGGCGGASSSTEPELVWGKRGVVGGELVKPRAVTIDAKDRVYVVDMTARIQVFDIQGKYQGHTWTPPDYRNGRPSGLSIDRDGNLLVSDSHYNCLRIYSPEGKLLRTLGGEGTSAQFSYVSDAIQDKDGYYYVAEFGDNHRITKLDSDFQIVCRWGSPGSEPGQFARIRALGIGPDGLLYAADVCNHRIQVFTRDGSLVRSWGSAGGKPGELSYPFDLAFSAGETQCIYVAELGNHRVQKFRLDGTPLGHWGRPGRNPGQLASPWALAVDSRGKVHVIDSENHRVQRIRF